MKRVRFIRETVDLQPTTVQRETNVELDESARLALGGQETNPPPIVNVPVKAEPEVPPSAGLLAAMELLEQVRSLHGNRSDVCSLGFTNVDTLVQIGTEEPPSQSVKREPGVKSEDGNTIPPTCASG